MSKEDLIKHWVNDFLVGSIWINDKNYRVKILDYGDNDVWLLYIANNNKTAWDIKKFLKEYKPDSCAC